MPEPDRPVTGGGVIGTQATRLGSGQAPPSPAASAPQAPHRVCFVATGLARGGAELQLFHSATGLRSLGFDVHVVCILSTDYYGAKLEQEGVPVTCLNASRTTSAMRILARFIRCVRRL